MSGFDVAVLGSGFAGTILSRCLAACGMTVVLIERGQHPRFALGESSTPLANLSLERLALRFGFDDLYNQAAWGRWQQAGLQRQGGLKRGFTFFRHVRGDRQPPSATRSLWVAASPDAARGDSQWLRASVDAALVQRAIAEGVEVMQGTRLVELRRQQSGWLLDLERGRDRLRLAADFFVDAAGSARFAGQHLGGGSRAAALSADLVYGHFTDVAPPPDEEPALYESAWSAVHHLLDDSWMYELRFGNGTVSAGVLATSPRAVRSATRGDQGRSPEAAFHDALQPYPWLSNRFSSAGRTHPVTRAMGIGYLARRAVGDGWAMLPHSYAFVDPLFSTGISWSLLGVERLAEVLAGARSGLRRYDLLLDREAAHLGLLLCAAYRNLSDFDRFGTVARAYFVAASFQETCQRLLLPAEAPWPSSLGLEPLGDWHWAGLLGADDPLLAALFRGLEKAQDDRAQLETVLAEACRTRDVAGFSAVANRYAVDVEALRPCFALLGLSAVEGERRLPRLWSPERFADAEAVHATSES